jgi:hypothetical protein
MVPFSKIRIKKKSGRKGKMKKSIKVGLILLIAMCASISGCGKKNTKITKEKIKKAATTANQNNETKTTKKKLKKPIYTKGVIEEIPYNKEYKKHDFTEDGTKDSFRYEKTDEENYTIYLNHQKLQKIFCARGGNLYYLRTKDQEVYLVQLIGQFGGNSLCAYQYDGQKFREVIGTEDFDKYSFAEQDIEKYENGILSTITEQIKPYDMGEFYTTFKARIKYRIKEGKLKLASRYFDVINPTKCKAASDFKTSKSLKNIKKQDGFEVKAGQEVLVKKIYLYDKNKEHLKHAFKIKCGKKKDGLYIQKIQNLNS